MDTLRQDLTFAWRSLRRTPGFTFTVILVMALGIGVNAMMYAMVRGVLMAPLPFPEPGRIVRFEVRNTPRGETYQSLSAVDILDLRRRTKTLRNLTGVMDGQSTLTLGAEPVVVPAGIVGADLPAVLGVRPALGRWFTPDETIPGNQFGSVVLSHRMWAEHFRSDPKVVGRVIRVSGRPRTVVGVMPDGFRFPEIAKLWVPLALDDTSNSRGARYIRCVARLAPGVTLEQSRAELATISAQFEREFPETNKGHRFRPVPLAEAQARNVRPMMILLSLAVGFVLLIACANVANMLLARATARHRELGVRLALGASRGRLVRQLLTESVLLALVGGVAGVLLAQWGLEVTLRAIPEEFPYWIRIRLDTGVLAFAVALSVATGLVFGVGPALHATSNDPNHALRDGSAGAGDSPARRRWRNALVVSEVALAVVLLIGAGLLVRSFLRMANQQNDLAPGNVFTATVVLPGATYPEDGQRHAFVREFRDALAHAPGTRAAGGVLNMHLGESQWTMSIEREGEVRTEGSRLPVLAYNVITPGYLDAIGARLLRGRDFTPGDDEDAPRVALVNASAARMLWPGQEALGKRWNFGGEDSTWVTVVGVVADLRQKVNSDDAYLPEIIVPYAQRSEASLTWAVRSSAPLADVANSTRRLLRERDPDLPLREPRSFAEHVRRSTWSLRIYFQLLGSFSLLAMLIAAIGIHGVMAYSVAQRTREIGIRMALGAAQTDVQRLVVGQAMRLTALGVGIGLAASWALTRFMASQLFGVRPDDPPTYAGVALILAASGLIAAWVPAARATRVNPVVALRAE